MSAITHTHNTCDRCKTEIVSAPNKMPTGWMEVRGEMWDKDGDSTGTQFHAFLCASCRSDLEDFKGRGYEAPQPASTEVHTIIGHDDLPDSRWDR